MVGLAQLGIKPWEIGRMTMVEFETFCHFIDRQNQAANG